jgi:hypothetical protein
MSGRQPEAVALTFARGGFPPFLVELLRLQRFDNSCVVPAHKHFIPA